MFILNKDGHFSIQSKKSYQLQSNILGIQQ
jgi:hypothetical protein